MKSFIEVGFRKIDLILPTYELDLILIEILRFTKFGSNRGYRGHSQVDWRSTPNVLKCIFFQRELGSETIISTRHISAVCFVLLYMAEL